MALSHSTAARNAGLNATLNLTDSGGGAGNLKFRASGSSPPAATAAATGTTLGTILLPATGWAAASGGTKALAGVPLSATLVASGTPDYSRFEDSTGANVEQGTVGTSGADMNFSSVTWLSGGTVTVTSYTVTAFA